MTTPSADAVQIAARRLRGQLVATPLVAASACLPGMAPGRDLRLKLEVLQPSGGVHYRGALHHLLRQLGSCKGVAVAAGVRRAFAVATAAVPLRVPVRCFFSEPLPEGWDARFAALGCQPEIADDPAATARAFCSRSGYRQVPGIADPDMAAGLATVGLELASELPAHCERVFVEAELAPAVAAGLAAGGHGTEVVPVPESAPPGGLADALAREHRVLCDSTGLSVLAAALTDRDADCCGALLSA